MVVTEQDFKDQNGRCTANKRVLTRHINKFNQMVGECDSLAPDIPELSKIRKANFLCEQIDKIKAAQSTLEKNAEIFTEFVYQITEIARTVDQQGVRWTDGR